MNRPILNTVTALACATCLAGAAAGRAGASPDAPAISSGALGPDVPAPTRAMLAR